MTTETANPGSVASLAYNRVALTAICTMLLAQLTKCVVTSVREGRLTFAPLTQSGGMPSSHTAMVSSAAVCIGLVEGWDTSVFGLALCVAAVTSYDAMGVRWAASKHAIALNLLLDMHLKQGYTLPAQFADPLAEVLGHKRQEVIGGFAFGVLSAILLGSLNPTVDQSLLVDQTYHVYADEVVCWIIIAALATLCAVTKLYYKRLDLMGQNRPQRPDASMYAPLDYRKSEDLTHV